MCAVICLGWAFFSPAAKAIDFQISIGDRPYYEGPEFWDYGWHYVWVPGHWGDHHHWVRGYYERRGDWNGHYGKHRHKWHHHDHDDDYHHH